MIESSIFLSDVDELQASDEELTLYFFLSSMIAGKLTKVPSIE